MGELLASLFVCMDIFSEEYVKSCQGESFHPQSFSSTHSPSPTTFINSENPHSSMKQSKKIHSVVPIADDGAGYMHQTPCSHAPLSKRYLKKRFGVWYEKDILLRST